MAANCSLVDAGSSDLCGVGGACVAGACLCLDGWIDAGRTVGGLPQCNVPVIPHRAMWGAVLVLQLATSATSLPGLAVAYGHSAAAKRRKLARKSVFFLSCQGLALLLLLYKLTGLHSRFIGSDAFLTIMWYNAFASAYSGQVIFLGKFGTSAKRRIALLEGSQTTLSIADKMTNKMSSRQDRVATPLIVTIVVVCNFTALAMLANFGPAAEALAFAMMATVDLQALLFTWSSMLVIEQTVAELRASHDAPNQAFKRRVDLLRRRVRNIKLTGAAGFICSLTLRLALAASGELRTRVELLETPMAAMGLFAQLVQSVGAMQKILNRRAESNMSFAASRTSRIRSGRSSAVFPAASITTSQALVPPAT